jgi:hypothetical protein
MSTAAGTDPSRATAAPTSSASSFSSPSSSPSLSKSAEEASLPAAPTLAFPTLVARLDGADGGARAGTGTKSAAAVPETGPAAAEAACWQRQPPAKSLLLGTGTRPRASSPLRCRPFHRPRRRLGPEGAKCDCASCPIAASPVSSLSRSQAPLSATRSRRRRRPRPRPTAPPTSSPQCATTRLPRALAEFAAASPRRHSPRARPPLAITMTRKRAATAAHTSLRESASRLRALGLRHRRRAVPDASQGVRRGCRADGCVSKKPSPLAQTNIVSGHRAHV